MSITAIAGRAFEATATNAPTGLVGTLGVRILDGIGGTTTPRTTDGIVETPAGSGTYVASLTAPTVVGQYDVSFDTGGAAPAYATEDLIVTATTIGEATDDEIRPAEADIAQLCGAYTRERVGGYGADAGRELGEFTTDTTPTLAQVEGFIDMAVREVRGRAGATISPREAPLARVAATWHAVAQVEAKRLPAAADDTSGSYANAISNYRATLDELIAQVRRGPVRLS